MWSAFYRTVASARELNESLLVIGGLPQSQAQQDVAQAAHAAWLLTDDGLPPMETTYRRPSLMRQAIGDR